MTRVVYEEKYQDAIYEYLRTVNFSPKLKTAKQPLLFDMEVPVPYQISFFTDTKKKENKMSVFCYKQDICIFREMFSDEEKKGLFINSDGGNTKTVLEIRCQFFKKNNSRKIGMPFVILELKMSEKLQPDEIIACSEKARMIKTLFPFCQYIFVVIGKVDNRIRQYGIWFDEIVQIDAVDKEVKNYEKAAKEKINDVAKKRILSVLNKRLRKSKEMHATFVHS